MKVNVEVIRKTIFNFEVDAVLDKYGNIDEDATQAKAFEEYEKAQDNNTLYENFYDEDVEYGEIDIEVENGR